MPPQEPRQITDQECLRKGEDFASCEVAVLVIVMKVEEPFDVLHEVIEHNAIQT